MSDKEDARAAEREALKAELVGLVASHKEGFASGTPEARRIDALIDLLRPLTPYPRAMDHGEVYGGRWSNDFSNYGKYVGGRDVTDQGLGAKTNLKTFSMGRLPEVPLQVLENGLEIDPPTRRYHLCGLVLAGAEEIPADLRALAVYEQREEDPETFFIAFKAFDIRPRDPDLPIEAFCRRIGIETHHVRLEPNPKLHSTIAYMDDDLRIQLGQLGGHYVMHKTDAPMRSMAIEH